jgi:hypothetical protein
MIRLRRLVPLALVAALTTCSGTEPAGPGWLDVRFVSPTVDDGGVMFVVRGGPVDSLRSSFADLYADRVSATEWRVIVLGNVSSTVVARLWVPDLDAVARYTATLEQVASGVTFAQRSTEGYGIAIERPAGIR